METFLSIVANIKLVVIEVAMLVVFLVFVWQYVADHFSASAIESSPTHFAEPARR
jgi:hypothetical protein